MGREIGNMHAAGLESARLQCVLRVMEANRHRWLTRRELRELCGPQIEDPTVCLREIRANGIDYECKKRGGTSPIGSRGRTCRTTSR